MCIALGRLTVFFPLPACRWLGRFLGGLSYWIIPRIRSVALSNLDLAYGESLPRADKVRIAKSAARNAGIVGGEFTRIALLEEDFVNRHVRFKGLEYIEPERGCVLMGAHLGNWEWMAPAMRIKHPKMAEIVRPMDEPRLRVFVDRTRTSTGMLTIPKAGAGREIVRLLREGYAIGILIDQSPRENGVPVCFFGQPCWGTIAPVMAAVRAHAPIIPISMIREPGGDYTIELHPPVAMVRTHDLRHDIVENSQRCQDVIEGMVRKHPEQWLWLHRRWKPRPLLEAEWANRIQKDRPVKNESLPE